MKKEITLANEEVVKIDANLTAMTLFKLEKEGIIEKSFLSTLFTVNSTSAQNVDLLDAFRTVYAAYRQANPKEHMKFEDFMEVYEVNLEEAFEVFGAIMSNRSKNNMAKGFQAKADKGKKD